MSDASKKILSFYDGHIDEHDSGPRAVGWNDKRSQEARFAAVCRVGDLDGMSVLDVGCGLGDLCGYIENRFQNVQYAGIDINPRYIERARQAYPSAHFEVVDFNTYEGKPADYVFASGVFAIKIPDHKKLYFEQIKRMFALARKGIAFTMLNVAQHADDEIYAAYSIDEVRELCLTMTDDVAVYQDYLPHDFTVVVRHRSTKSRGCKNPRTDAGGVMGRTSSPPYLDHGGRGCARGGRLSAR